MAKTKKQKNKFTKKQIYKKTNFWAIYSNMWVVGMRGWDIVIWAKMRGVLTTYCYNFC